MKCFPEHRLKLRMLMAVDAIEEHKSLLKAYDSSLARQLRSQQTRDF